MATTKKVYIENQTPHQTNFQSDSGKFSLSPFGKQDVDRSSVALIAEELADEPYVQRAINRGRLKILPRTEALERMKELDLIENASTDDVSEYLEEGADHITDHYKKELPDEAWATGPGWSARDILAGKRTEALKTVTQKAGRKSATEAVEKGARISDPNDDNDAETAKAIASMGRSSDD